MNIAHKRPKLAIVSTYGELCGIAAYTHFLRAQLEHDFDVEILPLDQSLLRLTNPRVRRVATKHIESIAARLPEFDFVNLQLEHGTFGSCPADVLRHLGILIDAARAVSVTFHSVPQQEGSPLSALAPLRRLKVLDTVRSVQAWRNTWTLSQRIPAMMSAKQAEKPLSVIVHTRRDRTLMQHAFGLNNVYDHPLAFLDGKTVEDVRATARREEFPGLSEIGDDAVLIGVFGFISRYKNVGMVLRALRLLPKNYHVLLFGAVHPQEITKFSPINRYLSEVLTESGIGISGLERLRDRNKDDPLNIMLDADAVKLLEPELGELHGRVHFMGAMDDPAFLRGMSICDSVVLPYLEVGQTSSGPIAQALEIGARVIASRNHAFLEFSRYHPGAIEFFDIGNYLELAQRISSSPPAKRAGRPKFNTDTNREVYLRANTLHHAPSATSSVRSAAAATVAAS
jgi:glycosyltransferase involved in cell wall biosynthesis